jgi:hypothetical protein
VCRVIGSTQQTPSTDAEKALDPVHALTRHAHARRLGVSLDRHEPAAEGVVARGEVAARAGAHQWCVGFDGRGGKAVADMQGVGGGEQHFGSPLVRSISRVMHRAAPRRSNSFRSVNVSQTDGDR